MPFAYDYLTAKDAWEIAEFCQSVSTKPTTRDGLDFYFDQGGLAAGCYLAASGKRALVGVCLYRGEPDHKVLRIDDVLIHPDFRRQKLATAFVHQVMSLARQNGWTCEAFVKERRLHGQLLLRACGWRCLEVISRERDRQALYRFAFPDPVGPRPVPCQAEPAFATK